MTFTHKAQRKTHLEPMVGLFITILANNLINLVVMAIWLLLGNRVVLDPQGLLFFMLGGVLNSFVGRGLLFWCIALLGAARAGLMKAMVPLFVLFGGVFLLEEELDSMAWLGIGIVLIGLLLMSLDSIRHSGRLQPSANSKPISSKDMRHHIYKGIAIGIASAFFLGTGNLCRKAGITLIPDTVIAVTSCSFFALLACGLLLLFRGMGTQILEALRHVEKDYILSGVFTSGALYALFGAMMLIPISSANSISATEPMFTFLLASLMGRERLRIQTVLCGIVMVIGTLLLVLN